MNIEKKVEKIVPVGNAKKIIVWGIGNVGIHAIYLLLKLGKKIDYIVDSDVSKQGEVFVGIEVKNPMDLLYEDLENIVVFIAAGDYKTREIEEQMRSMGFEHNKNYFTLLSVDRYAPVNKIDFMLGYSRGG